MNAFDVMYILYIAEKRRDWMSVCVVTIVKKWKKKNKRGRCVCVCDLSKVLPSSNLLVMNICESMGDPINSAVKKHFVMSVHEP